MGLRFVLLIAAVVAAVWILARLRKSRPRPAAGTRVGTMVRCAHCGLHLPVDEALRDAAGQPFCSAEHRDLGPAAPPDE